MLQQHAHCTLKKTNTTKTTSGRKWTRAFCYSTLNLSHTQTTNHCPLVTTQQPAHSLTPLISVLQSHMDRVFTRPNATNQCSLQHILTIQQKRPPCSHTERVHTASHYKPVSSTNYLDNTTGTTCMQSHRACSHNFTLQISVLYKLP